MAVTLVQVFEVPEGREEEFLNSWLALTESLKSAAGFYGTRLLRRTSDRVGRFAFVNIGSWESTGAKYGRLVIEHQQGHIPGPATSHERFQHHIRYLRGGL